MTTSAPDQTGLVLARLGRVMNGRIRRALDESGLAPRHGAVLSRLARCGPTGQQQLIDVLSIDPSALVSILNDLERDRLIERRRDPADRRRHIVDLTGGGRRAVGAVEQAIADVEREAFADLSDAELSQLRSLLARIRTHHDCGPAA